MGVALLLETDIAEPGLTGNDMDIADPGRGLGLGLGGPSDADSSDSPDSSGMGGGVARSSVDPEISNRNSFFLRVSIADRLPREDAKSRGFLPLSRTFFRALIPTQLTSCFIASRSETSRRGRGVVPRAAPGLGRVWNGDKAFGRRGVENGWAEYGGLVVGGLESGLEEDATLRGRGVSMPITDGMTQSSCTSSVGRGGNASRVGPQENPMKWAGRSFRKAEGVLVPFWAGVACKIDKPGEDESLED
jgi:hypothetical protein